MLGGSSNVIGNRSLGERCRVPPPPSLLLPEFLALNLDQRFVTFIFCSVNSDNLQLLLWLMWKCKGGGRAPTHTDSSCGRLFQGHLKGPQKPLVGHSLKTTAEIIHEVSYWVFFQEGFLVYPFLPCWASVSSPKSKESLRSLQILIICFSSVL